MENIEYAGEHLWAGNLGHGFVILSFVAALLACVSFVLAAKNSAYVKLARWSFNIHGFSVIGIALTLFVMLFNHFFEYQYVWQHSNTEMSMKYILSCFWEGQEGSFLLWTFWNAVLGWVLKRQLKNSEWEAPVLAVISLVQVFLASMILGLYFGNYKLGTNPFLLLREHPDFAEAPFVKMPNYLAKLNGRGLNPLLMNYWMTIHPPTLFLGFASTIVPFAFAIAAFWNRRYHEWQRVALPWTFFGILVLGIGILMGGAWAYEALSFGGFWAWDPVENSSLVPWLVLVAAGHTMIINRNRGGSLFTTHFLSIGAFLLVLYSTFLTRSGILGNSSVHAFTDLGMTGQLVLYVLTFIFISVWLLSYELLLKVSYAVISLMMLAAAVIIGYAKIILMLWLLMSVVITVISYRSHFPKEKKEEELFSREFWMFVGSLLLLLSALIITYYTSIPVINKLFGTDAAPPKVPLYNKLIIPFAFVIMLLVATAQFLKYKKSDTKKFFIRSSFSFGLALVFGLVCTIPLYFIGDYAKNREAWEPISYTLLFIAALYAVLANADYWLNVLNGKISKSGAAIAHIGFGLIMLGALVSTSKKATLSKNTSAMQVKSLGENFDDNKSILLTKGDTLPMGPYLVSYKEKRREGINVYFKVDYFKLNKENKPEYDFSLEPHIQDNPRMGKAAEPDTRHYLNRDIYTHVTYADLNTEQSEQHVNSYSSPQNYVRHRGDTIYASNAMVIVDSLRTNVTEKEYSRNDSLLEVTVVLRCKDTKSHVYFARPKFIIKKNMMVPDEAVVEELGLKFVFWKINPEDGSVEIEMSERASNTKDFIVMEAYVFPYINVLWLGCLVMAFGTFIAIRERMRKLKPVTTDAGKT